MTADIITGDQLDAMAFDPLHWCVEGIIPEGTGVLVSPPKVGKSFLVAGVGLACACGGVALGQFDVSPRPVLYLALEDGYRRLQSRFRTILGGHAIPANISVVTSATPESAREVIGKFFVTHKDAQPLVILDTLGKILEARNAKATQYGHDYQQVSALIELQRLAPGSTLLIVHHTKKGEENDYVDKVSGTTGIAGAADFIMLLKRERADTAVTLSVTGRDVTEQEYALKFEDCLWTIDDAGHEKAAAAAEYSRYSENTSRVVAFVREIGVTRPHDVAEHLGIDSKRASEILGRSADRGLIAKIGWGTYAPAPAGESAESAESPGREGTSFPQSDLSAESPNPQSDSSAEFDTGSDQVIPHNPHFPGGCEGGLSSSSSSSSSDDRVPDGLCQRCLEEPASTGQRYCGWCSPVSETPYRTDDSINIAVESK